MAKLLEITKFLDQALALSAYEDASQNGLQIEGRDEVKVVAVAVDAGERVADQAIALGADLLFVHHGIFWGKPFLLCGPDKRKIEKFFKASLGLYAAHLPLDGDPVFGNNFLLSNFLGLSNPERAVWYGSALIGCKASNDGKLSLETIVERLTQLPRGDDKVLNLNFGPTTPEKIAIVSGGGADFVRGYQELGIDTYITGEPKQFLYHFAAEHKLNVICAGHYATETVGVRAVGEELSRRFGVTAKFIDDPTGI